jgi:hypothetical protein
MSDGSKFKSFGVVVASNDKKYSNESTNQMQQLITGLLLVV